MRLGTFQRSNHFFAFLRALLRFEFIITFVLHVFFKCHFFIFLALLIWTKYWNVINRELFHFVEVSGLFVRWAGWAFEQSVSFLLPIIFARYAHNSHVAFLADYWLVRQIIANHAAVPLEQLFWILCRLRLFWKLSHLFLWELW